VPAGTFYVGQYADGTKGNFDGSIAEAAVYNYRLSPGQIKHRVNTQVTSVGAMQIMMWGGF